MGTGLRDFVQICFPQLRKRTRIPCDSAICRPPEALRRSLMLYVGTTVWLTDSPKAKYDHHFECWRCGARGDFTEYKWRKGYRPPR